MSWQMQWLLETSMLSAIILIAASFKRFPAVVRHVLVLIAVLKFLIPPTFVALPFAPYLGRGHHLDGWFFTRVWAVGAAIVFVAMLTRLWRLHVLAAASETISDPGVLDLFSRTAREIGLRRLPRLLVSDEALAPISFGIARPSVLIARSLAESDEEALRVVFAHELVHHLRRDLWIGHLQAWLSVVWWFDPFFLLISRRLSAVREEACDDFVISRRLATDDAYCAALLRAASTVAQRTFAIPATSMASAGHPLERRIRRIMATQVVRVDRLSTRWRFAVLLLAAMLLPGYVSSVKSSASPSPSSSPSPSPSPSP